MLQQERLHTKPMISSEEQRLILQETVQPVESENKSNQTQIWSHQFYLDRFLTLSAYETDEARTAALLEDVRHLVMEMILAEPITTYDYWLDLQTNHLKRDSYSEDMSSMESTFVQALLAKGLTASRGLTEYLVFQRIHQQLTAIANSDTSQTLLVTSPPDRKSAGYHGSDCLETDDPDTQESHHSFIYLMRISGLEQNELGENVRAHIDVQQYRSWHNLSQLVELHRQFGAPIELDPTQPIPNQLLANVILLQTTPERPFCDTQKTVEQLIYQDSHTWKFQPNQAPKLADKNEFWVEVKTLFEQFYLPKALLIFRQLSVTSTEEEKTEALRELDLAFSFFFRSLEQRVQELNTNPLYQQLIDQKQPRLQRWLKHLKPKKINREDQPLPQKIGIIDQLYQLDKRVRLKGQKLSQKERRFYFSNLGRVLELGNFVFGSAQCFTLAPFTLPISVMRSPLTLASLPHFDSTLALLSTEMKHTLYHSLVEQDYRELVFNVNGKAKTYMVPQNYGHDFTFDGDNVLGPCKFPLDQDPLVFSLNKHQFGEYLSHLKTNLHQTSVSRIKEAVSQAKLSLSEQAEAALLVTDIEKIVFRPTISLTEFIAGVSPLTMQALPVLGEELFRQLRQSSNAVRTLQEIRKLFLASSSDHPLVQL